MMLLFIGKRALLPYMHRALLPYSLWAFLTLVRTSGTLIGLWMMKHLLMSAAEVIAWLRIARPGSVIGAQQHYLVQQQDRMQALGRARIHGLGTQAQTLTQTQTQAQAQAQAQTQTQTLTQSWSTAVGRHAGETGERSVVRGGGGGARGHVAGAHRDDTAPLPDRLALQVAEGVQRRERERERERRERERGTRRGSVPAQGGTQAHGAARVERGGEGTVRTQGTVEAQGALVHGTERPRETRREVTAGPGPRGPALMVV